MKPIALVMSCEHASNAVPTEYQALFKDNPSILETHRAYDPGALEIADGIAQQFPCDYVKASVTRLLIDSNRSLKHPACFSEFTQTLPEHEKQRLTHLFYLPFRKQVKRFIQEKIKQGNQVLHLSIHTFPPEFKGITRNAAISLLYDSARHAEKEVARIWHEILLTKTPSYRIRMNYPYPGSSNSLTSTLRKAFSQKNYLGFEVESNQALATAPNARAELIEALSDSLKQLLEII